MSTLWRYTAIDLQTPAVERNGELTGASAADVRASLRRIGLQVIELRAVRSRSPKSDWAFIGRALHSHLRARRRLQRTELYDSLSTMLNSGLPLLEALQTLIDSSADAPTRGIKGMGRMGGVRGVGWVLVQMREQLRGGESLGQAMKSHPGWFDATDVAIVEAGQYSGTLPGVLASMAQRQEASNELGQKLIGALAYPTVVIMVGIGVVVFLSVKTLPELVKILTNAKVPPPALTLRVMWVGQLLAHHWWELVGLLVIGCVGLGVLPVLIRRWHLQPFPPQLANRVQRLGRRFSPKVLRTMAVGGLALRLSDLVRSGVPIVDSLRVIAPTARSRALRETICSAAARIEQGEELSSALADGRWFDAEMRRLLDIGQASGELDIMLERIGHRYQRQAKRLIDRLAVLLEPAVILTLAVLVGTVVMSAILPLLRLQEII